MPPVGEEKPETTEWGIAMKAALEKNKAAGHGPNSWRALAKALFQQPGSNQAEDNWLKTLKNYRDERAPIAPREGNAQLIANALGVRRADLPGPSLSTAARISRLEERAVTLDDLFGLLAVLQGAIASVATGDAAQAQRALTDFETRLRQ